MKQFIVTHTIHQTEISSLLDSWVTNTPCVTVLYPKQKLLLLILSSKHNMLTIWSTKDVSSFSYLP